MDSPGRRRFSISNSTSYFSGYTDLSGGSYGHHIPGEMSGLWHPPLRLLRSLAVAGESAGEVIQRYETLPDRRIFHFSGFSIELSMPEGHLMLVRCRCRTAKTCTLAMETGPSAVWFSDWQPECRTRQRGQKVEMSFSRPRWEFSIVPSRAVLTVEGNIVRTEMEDDASLLVTGGTDGAAGGYVASPAATSIQYPDVLSSCLMRCSSPPVEEAFYWSKLGLHWLAHRQDGLGYGITAGHPEFPWYFGLDAFHSMDALLQTGQWACARGTLEILSSFARTQEGRVPHEIVTNGRVYNPGDMEESAMYPSALWKYLDWTGDTAFAAEHLSDAAHALRYVVQRDFVGPGAMEDPERGSAKEIDTMCHFVEGAEALRHLASSVQCEDVGWEDGISDVYDLASSTRKYIRNEMWLAEIDGFANRVVGGDPVFRGHWTSIAPFVAGIASDSQYSSFAMSPGNGLSLHSSPGGLFVEPEKRNVMPVLNGLMAVAASKYRDFDTMHRFYSSNVSVLGQFMPCALPEIIGSEEGCFLQAWSSAMIVHPLLSGYLGLSLADGGPRCTPMLKEGLLSSVSIRRLRVREALYSVDAETDGGPVKTTISEI